MKDEQNEEKIEVTEYRPVQQKKNTKRSSAETKQIEVEKESKLLNIQQYLDEDADLRILSTVQKEALRRLYRRDIRTFDEWKIIVGQELSRRVY
jgi:hypothetical protein